MFTNNDINIVFVVFFIFNISVYNLIENTFVAYSKLYLLYNCDLSNLALFYCKCIDYYIIYFSNVTVTLVVRV